MTQSPTSGDDHSQVAAQRMLPASDETTVELRSQLPKLAIDVMNEPGLRKEFVDLDRVETSAVLEHIDSQADRLLAETNTAIANVRSTHVSLEQYETVAPPPQEGGKVERQKLPLATFLLGSGISLAAFTPVFAWGLRPYTTTVLGGFPALLISIGVLLSGVGVCTLIFGLVARKYDPQHTFAFFGTLLAVALTGSLGLGLLMWRSWSTTFTAIGVFAWAIWIIVLAIALSLIAAIVAQIADQLSSRTISQTCLAYLSRASGLLAIVGVYGVSVGVTAAILADISPNESASLATLTALLIPIIRASVVPIAADAYTRLQTATTHSGRPTPTEQERLTQAHDMAMDEWRRVMRIAIRDNLKVWLMGIVKPEFSHYLNIISSKGLLQMSAHDSIVATEGVFGRFEKAITRISGGAIGVAGPQGVGKTTLLDAYREGRFMGAGREHLVVFESVPVRYDPRDFALHLYAALCRAVMAFTELHPEAKRDSWISQVRKFVLRMPRSLAFLALAATSYLVLTLLSRQILDNKGWVGTLVWLITALGIGYTIFVFSSRTGVFQNGIQLPAEVIDLSTLAGAARQKLEGIQFQQRHTTGWSGNLTTAFGLGANRSSSVERTRQAMSYPELVRDFRDFLVEAVRVISEMGTASVAPIAIIIDELDKIQDPDQAQEFIDEVKALFSVAGSGCLFLVSISEEALASYERRGLPLRATFDRTFDLIFRIDHLKLPDTRALLRNRIVGLSEPFVCLCHCLSGGLPREIVRTARAIVGCDERELTKVAQAVVSADMAAKESEFRTLIGLHVEAEPYSSELIRHMEDYTGADPGRLFASLQNPPVTMSDTRGSDNPLRELKQLQVESLCYRYYWATILAIFNDEMPEEAVVKGQGNDHSAGFDRLADARRLLSVNARLAWFRISSFRRSWHLDVASPPF